MKYLPIILLALSITVLSYAADEEIELTTYYPAPYGEYEEVTADRLSVGDTGSTHANSGIMNFKVVNDDTSSGGTVPDGTQGNIYYSQVDNELKYNDGTAPRDWKSLGSTTASSSFCVHKNGSDQNVNTPSRTWGKITYSTKLYDTNNDFDLTNNRHVPTIGGKYVYTVNTLVRSLDEVENYDLAIYKNGAIFCRTRNTAVDRAGGEHTAINFTTPPIPMNGTSDFIEVYIRVDDDEAYAVEGDQPESYFSGYMVSS